MHAIRVSIRFRLRERRKADAGRTTRINPGAILQIFCAPKGTVRAAPIPASASASNLHLHLRPSPHPRLSSSLTSPLHLTHPLFPIRTSPFLSCPSIVSPSLPSTISSSSGGGLKRRAIYPSIPPFTVKPTSRPACLRRRSTQ